MSTTPWDIYAEQLLPVGYGHPLWIPEPNEREVEIGDVGWLKTGEFRALFNSMQPHDDPVNLDKGVPRDFNVFRPQNLSVAVCDRIMQKMVCSRSLITTDAQGNVGAGTMVPPVSAGAGIKFQSTSDSGAFVLLDAPAQSKEIDSKRHIVNYMRDNFESWLEFANASYSWGLDLKEQDIIFVCGTTKTSKWAVAAFQGNRFRKTEGFVTGDFGPFASVGLSINISNQILPAEHYRHAAGVLVAAQGAHAGRWRPASAPAWPDNPGMDAPMMTGGEYEFESEQGFDIAQGYDPVNILLDYILSQSVETEVAIASDLDLYAIFADREFPNANDMPAVLEELRPTIEVDERGVGTIAADYRVARKRRNDDLLEEGEQTHKRARSTGEFPYADPSPSSQMPYAPQEEDASMLDVTTQFPATIPDPIGGLAPTDDDGAFDVGAPPGEKAAGKRPEFGAQASVHDGSVTALTYSADGSFAASGSEDTCIVIWDRLEGHEDTVSALAFSRDNRVLASASQDERIILWDVAEGTKIREIVPDSAVHSLVYTPDGRKLIAGTSDGKLHIWRSGTYALEKTIGKNAAVVTFIVFSRDRRRMATGGTESVCYIWETAQLDAESPEPLSVLEGHRGMVSAAAFSPDGNRVVTASDDGSSRIWKAETGEALVILHEHTGPVWSVAFSPDGKRVASGSSDSTVKVCDSYSGERLLSLDGHDSMINAVEFSPDGQWIASAASDNTVRLWKASDGVCTTTFNEHNDNVTSAMFSPDGLMLASGSHDGTSTQNQRKNGDVDAQEVQTSGRRSGMREVSQQKRVVRQHCRKP
ncbi:WD40-repeat-containing domain protein [Cerioporus squamosus]|nr:WD40-repeat-containing domain protein [Cerioporus squamosus]